MRMDVHATPTTALHDFTSGPPSDQWMHVKMNRQGRLCRRRTYYIAARPSKQMHTMQPRQQEQQRHLIYASRSSREGVANACMKSTVLSEDKPSVRQRIRTETDRTVTSSLPSWAASARVDPGQVGPGGGLTLVDARRTLN